MEKRNTGIKQQAELRGHRFTDFETKGGRHLVRGKIEKAPRFNKYDYLNILYKLMKI